MMLFPLCFCPRAQFCPDNAQAGHLSRILLLHIQTWRGVQIAQCNLINMTIMRNIALRKTTNPFRKTKRTLYFGVAAEETSILFFQS